MSQLKTNSITNIANTGDANIELYADGSTSIRNLQNLSNNVVINGAMNVAQRGTNFSAITTGPSYAVDRWRWQGASVGTWEVSQSSDAPTEAGFAKSFKAECTSGTSLVGTTFAVVRTVLEGQDLQQFAKGTASAKNFALSFWVKSTTAGTYSIYLYDNDNNREISATYTVDAASTWEYKTIIIDPDTVGAFADDNGDSLYVSFFLAAGSDNTSGTFNSTWQAENNSGRVSSSQAQLNTTGQQFWITGIQLEAGSRSTSFKHESYAETLAKCQRYYQNIQVASSTYTGVFWGSPSNTFLGSFVSFPVEMRTTPTDADLVSAAAPFYWVWPGQGVYSTNTTANVAINTCKNGWRLRQTRTAGGTSPENGKVYVLEPQFYLGINAEL